MACMRTATLRAIHNTTPHTSLTGGISLDRLRDVNSLRRRMDALTNSDIFYEVLSRVDGVTLATISCASSSLRSISGDDRIWERLCNSLWPSTKDPEVKSLISYLGGFRKFHSECYPVIVNAYPLFSDDSDTSLKTAEIWSDDEDDMIEELSGMSTDDLVSVIDVVFRGKSVESKVIHGIPGAEDFHGWFSNCPFRFDALSYNEDDEEEASPSGVIRDEDLPTVTCIEKERKDGRFWKALRDDIRVSWIIANKKTKLVANLASWRPLGGQRHWPSDQDFLVRFGSILPAHRLLHCKVVQCNVVLKCRIVNSHTEEGLKSSLKIAELSMQLEDMGGVHLNGRHSLLVVKEALSGQKSVDHFKFLESYRQYISAQSQLKEKKLKSEGRVDTVCIVCGIISFMLFLYFLF